MAVDELFLMKKLKEVELKDFCTAAMQYVKEQGDYEKIFTYYCEDEEGRTDEGILAYEVNSTCEGIFEDKLYRFGTVRGAMNAVVTKLRQEVYKNLGEQQVKDKINSGDYIQQSGILIGSYDWEIQKNDGGSFIKQFIAMQTDDGVIEVSLIGDKIGSRRYGVPVPWMKEVTLAIEPRKFFRANQKEDIDNAIIRVLDVVDDEYIFDDLIAMAEDKDLIYDIDRIIEEFPPNGNLKIGDWFWFKGVAKVNRAMTAFPVFEFRQQTGDFHHLTVVDKNGSLRYTFNLGVKGKFLKDEGRGYYPTVRMQPVQIAKTDVDWSDDLIELVDYLNQSSETLTPEQQFDTLSNNIVDRVFYALVKLVKIERREGPSNDPDDQDTTVERFFINLNTVYVKFTDKFDIQVSSQEETEKEDKKETKSGSNEQKPKVNIPHKSWKPKLKKKIVEWLSVMSEATFESLKENGVFDDFKDVPDSALKEVFDEIKKEMSE